MSRHLLTCSALATAVLALSACTTGSARSASTQKDRTDASGVVASLGAVPIPSNGPAEPTPTARIGHPAVLAMGGPVQVDLGVGHRLLAVALGPNQARTLPTGDPGSPQATLATVTFRVTALTGATTVNCAELTSRDETGRAIQLTPLGRARATAQPGRPATIVLEGTFTSGAAQLTWRADGHVLGIWTFTIEID